MKIYFGALLFSLLIVGCSPTKKLSKINLTNTTWHYTDSDGDNYNISFNKAGQLSSTNKNDTTPDNDTWKQQGHMLIFQFNDGYSTYQGQLKNTNLIEGSASNNAESWTWALKREARDF